MNNTIQALKIAQTNVKNTINSQTKKLNFTNKFDEVDLSTKPKMSKGKKALIIAGAAVGAAAITAGIVALVYRGKIKNIQKEAALVQESSQKVIDEYMEKFKNVQPIEDNIKIIKEFAQDGKTLTRRAIFSDNKYLTIDDYINKTTLDTQTDGGIVFRKHKNNPPLEEFIFDENNKLFSYTKWSKRGSSKAFIFNTDGQFERLLKSIGEDQYEPVYNDNHRRELLSKISKRFDSFKEMFKKSK